VLRRRRKWAAARRTLEQSLLGFEALDSLGWAEGARADLARVGARRPSPPGALTHAEQRVAELAAVGQSNTEIARTLRLAEDGRSPSLARLREARRPLANAARTPRPKLGFFSRFRTHGPRPTLAAMVEFALELYVSRTDATAVRRNVELARTAAEGTSVRYLRSIFMPEDETCFLFFEASSAAAVGEIADLAGLSARVVEAAAL
jgi:hypothetical protein